MVQPQSKEDTIINHQIYILPLKNIYVTYVGCVYSLNERHMHPLFIYSAV